MVRSTGFSAFVGLRITSVTVAIVAGILACSDNTAPIARPGLDPSTIHVVNTPDSIKQAYYALMATTGMSNLSAPTQALSASSLPTSNFSRLVIANDVAAAAYTENHIDFAPESDPQNVVPSLSDDGYVTDMPIGFNFTFYGNTYDKLNLYLNGFITFGQWLPGAAGDEGFWHIGGIPAVDAPNNMIALGWADWNTRLAPGSVTYETRGAAPNRRFLVQFKNVPESGAGGRFTGQLVLFEGSNEIAMHVASMNITGFNDRETQGIENADGTEALFDSVQLANGMWSPRSRGFYRLTSDAIKFSPAHINQPPVVVPPANISVNTDPGVCTAAVSLGAASVTDDAAGSTVAGARSDAAALDAAYPNGVTTVTWTATDAGSLTAAADQTVTVSDKQAPSVVAHPDISVRADRSASTATVAIEGATATDNCGDVKVSGVRSDGVPMSAGFPVGVTTITWSATDAANNTGSATQIVTVIGNRPPVVSAPPSLVLNTDPHECSAQRNPGAPIVTDDTDGFTVVGVRSDHVTDLNAAYAKGVTMIVWTATDADGLTASESQTISVSDKEKPSIVAPASVSAANDAGLASASVAAGSPSGLDNCAGVSVSAARSDGGGIDARYPVGVTTITWTATDASGNSASASQTITVRDVESPVLNVPADFTVNATSPSGAVVFFNVSALDNVGAGSVSCSPASGSTFAIGTRSVVCTVADAAGNSTSRSFNVQVVGAGSQLVSLIQYILNLDLPNGVTNPLVNKLRSVGDASDAQGCSKMNDFLSMLAKKGSGVTDAQYNYMIGESQRIMADMGCPDFRALKPRAVPRTITRVQSPSSPASAGVVKR